MRRFPSGSSFMIGAVSAGFRSASCFLYPPAVSVTRYFPYGSFGSDQRPLASLVVVASLPFAARATICAPAIG